MQRLAILTMASVHFGAVLHCKEGSIDTLNADSTSITNFRLNLKSDLHKFCAVTVTHFIDQDAFAGRLLHCIGLQSCLNKEL